jgi:hypothetical protein
MWFRFLLKSLIFLNSKKIKIDVPYTTTVNEEQKTEDSREVVIRRWRDAVAAGDGAAVSEGGLPLQHLTPGIPQML